MSSRSYNTVSILSARIPARVTRVLPAYGYALGIRNIRVSLNNRYPHWHLPYYCDHVYYWVMYVRGQISQQLWIDRAIALYPFPAKTWCCETDRRVILLPTPTIIGTSWKLATDKGLIRALLLHTFNVSKAGILILY